MSQEWMLRTLIDSSINIKDAQLYVHLAVNGPQNVQEIATALKTDKRQVYRTVKQLCMRQLILPCCGDSSKFNAVPFDKVLDLLLKSRLDEAKRIETVFGLTDKTV